MRMILVGVMMGVAVGVPGPACAGMDADCPAARVSAADCHAPQVGGEVHFVNPTRRVIEERHRNAGAEFGFAVASSAINILYTPFRLVYGVLGAGFGGFAGWTTGGDMRTAKGIWRPTTEGHYFVRPDYLDGTERFRFCGAVPPRYEPEQVVVVERSETRHSMPGHPEPLDAPPFEEDSDTVDDGR